MEIYTAFGKGVMSSSKGSVQFECGTEKDAELVAKALNRRRDRINALVNAAGRLMTAVEDEGDHSRGDKGSCEVCKALRTMHRILVGGDAA